MASEPRYSETMSSETTSSAMISGDSAAPARGKVSPDAALILEALGRLESAVQDERAVLDRLRVALRDMAQTIAMAKALADSETAAALLDEFEHRIDAMIEIAGGAPEAAEVAPVAVAEAHAEPPAPEAEPPAAEHDEVPTVTGVVSRLGPDRDPFNEAVVNALHAAEGADQHAPSVAMLKAMVEAMGVASQTAEAAPEVVEPQHVETDHVAEPPQAIEAEHAAAPMPLPVVDIEPPEPAAEVPEPVAAVDDAALDWPPLVETPEPAPEPAAAAIEPPAEVLELHEVQVAEVQVAETSAAMAVEPPAITTVDLPPAAAIDSPPEPAVPTSLSMLIPPGIHETALLASIERMGGVRPTLPADEGTAVIFTAKVEPAFAPPAPIETAAAPEVAAAPQPVPPTEPPLDAELVAAMADPDFDPTDFLFGPESEPEPAAFLLDPAPEPPAQPKPPEDAKHDEPPHDPLRALNAMSENEKIALFS